MNSHRDILRRKMSKCLGSAIKRSINTIKYQNLHTHTTYCDGTLSAEKMIKAAIEKGGGSLGFSEHSFVPFDLEYSMRLEDTPGYINEINSLKRKYEGVIEIFLGLEMDYFTDNLPNDLDYVIGAVHHVEKNGKYITVDGWAEHLENMTNEFFTVIIMLWQSHISQLLLMS